MKILDRFLIILFNICLLVVGIWISAVPIAKSKLYYKIQFKVNEIYSHKDDSGQKIQKEFYFLNGEYQEAKFTDEQLDIMIDHIIDYLFGNKENFELQLQNVWVDGETIEEKVSIFGKQAVDHMKDVKNLFITYQIISVICFLVLLAILAYLMLRIGQVRKILYKYTFVWYFIFCLSLGSFFLITAIHTFREYGTFDFDTYFYTMWGDVHYLLFPFQPDKIEGSFFNDILTEILTVDLFVLAFAIVICVVITLNLIWLVATIAIRKYGEKIANKIKQSKYSNPKLNSEEYFSSSN